MMFELLEKELARRHTFEVVSTTDRSKNLQQVAQLTARNVFFAICAVARTAVKLITGRGLMVLFVSQERLPLIRDAILMAVAKVTGNRYVLYLHGSRLPSTLREWTFPLGRWIKRLVEQSSDIWVLGNVDKRSLVDIGAESERVHVIPNAAPEGVDISAPRHAPRRPIRLGVLSNLSRDKGVLVVIEAAGLVAGPCELILAGPFLTKEDELFSKAAIEQLDVPVRLLGRIDRGRMASTLDTMDVFIFPTRYANEGQPLVVIEAMARGLPVIVSDIGSLRECVGDAGIVLDQVSPEAVAAAVDALAQDHERYADLSRAAIKRSEGFTRDAWRARIQSRLDDLVVAERMEL